MTHPSVIRPEQLAVFDSRKMGKATLYESAHLLVGLNAFEPGQEHALHTHEGMDKVYYVLSGQGEFLLESGSQRMRAGDLLAVPGGVPHGIRNGGAERLVVMAMLAPAPSAARTA